jgi:hypothetical protein
MANITFKGICSGTSTKHSNKSGNDYKITSFVEVPSLNKFEVFGDLGLSAHEDVREYVLEAGITGLNNVIVKAGSVASKK